MKAVGGSDEGDIQEAKTEARAPRRKREQAEQDARPAPAQMPAGTSQMQRGTWRTQERERAAGDLQALSKKAEHRKAGVKTENCRKK